MSEKDNTNVPIRSDRIILNFYLSRELVM